jgi:hypothetical protein
MSYHHQAGLCMKAVPLRRVDLGIECIAITSGGSQVIPCNERRYMLIRGMPDQDGGAVEQWLVGPSSSRFTRDLSGRSTGSAQEPGMLSGESQLCPGCPKQAVPCLSGPSFEGWPQALVKVSVTPICMCTSALPFCTSPDQRSARSGMSAAMQTMTYQRRQPGWTGGSAGRRAATGALGATACAT